MARNANSKMQNLNRQLGFKILCNFDISKFYSRINRNMNPHRAIIELFTKFTMKIFIAIMTIVITLQYASGQSNQTQDLYFDNASFVQAKINNEDASKFFSNYPYNSTISGNDGNVLVSFIVRKDGHIDSVQVLNNPGILYKNTALEALNSSSGHWNPCRSEDELFDKKYFAGFNFTNSHMFFYKKDKILRLLKTGQTTKPLKLITEALKINPFDIDLLLWRSRIYKKQNKHDLELVDLLMAEKLSTDLIFNIWF
jgi:hypothetical protein